MTQAARPDVVIVGGGLVGLASAYRILRVRPDLRVLVLEKERSVAAHQSGRNSGVIHSGLYYRPGSYRARLCVRGRRTLKEFCDEKGVRAEVCGKLVVATREDELPRLEELLARGIENGLRVRRIGPEEMREFEPHVAGRAALHVPEAGIADYPGVARALRDEVARDGGEVRTGDAFVSARETSSGVVVRTASDEFEARALVACAGLQSDRVAKASGVATDVIVAPFRGEYYELVPEAERLVRNLIYPTPDPRFPFLGVHFTRMARGGIEAGPNAVIALRREGYSWRDVSPRDLIDAFTSRGFLRFTSAHLATGVAEIARSLSKDRFTATLARLVPEIRSRDLVRGGAGVRAMALLPSGAMVDDFHFAETARQVHVLNAPSPAATACLAIGEEVATRLLASRF